MGSLDALAHPSVFPWLCLVLGLVVGSFLNVVIHRLPKMMERGWQEQCAELRGEPAPGAEPMNLIVPGSRCPACGHAIAALENIPLLSYAWLRGKCSACNARIGWRYPLVELLAGVAGMYCAWRYGFGLAAFAAMIFLWAVISASFIDFDSQLLPDSITLALLWTGLLVNLGGTFIDLRSAVIGAAAGYLSLWLVYWGFKFATGKEGMGFGDFKLLAAIGAWTGWQMLPLVILLSSFVGAIVGILLIVLARHGRSVPIPFGPYLAVAGVVALFWGPQITRAYLNQFI
ncbi:MAG: methyltransferase [Betaproteobacteria bacterium RIFCSPLOWO2_02_FULL_64_12]|nr:MAG: methyltransferase [Betaproteobacteria bacterium RIFCSPLOWO2_02_FULL_64_12]